MVLTMQNKLKYAIVIACYRARDMRIKHYSGSMHPLQRRVARSCKEYARAPRRLRSRSSGTWQRTFRSPIANSMPQNNCWEIGRAHV